MAVPTYYTNFGAGLVTRAAPYLLDEGLGPLPSRDLSNVVSTVSGTIQKRNGLVTFASPATPFTSLFPLEAVGPFLIGATGTTLVSVSAAGATATIKTGLTSNLRWEFVSAPVVSAQGPLFGMNGTDTPQHWTGSGNTANWTATDSGGTVPNGKYCIYAGNQVFVAGVASTPSRVYWSGLGDPTAWNPANLNGSGFDDFDPGDGQAITGLGRVGPYILVTKPRKMWLIVDPETSSTRRISDQIGCVAHRSIMEGSEGTYFLSEDRGVYLTNGTSLKPISDQIQPTIDLVGGQKANAAGSYFAGHYYLSVAGAGSGSNDTTLDFDASLQSWWRHSFGSNQFAVWHPASSAQLYSAKPQTATVDQAFVNGVYTDNGNAMTWRWAGPWQSPSFYRRRLFPTSYYRKRLRQVRCDGIGTVDFSLAKDFATTESLIASNVFAGGSSGIFGSSGTFGGTGIFGGAPTINRNKFSCLGIADAFSIVFSATSNTPDSVDSFLLILHDRRDGVVQ